jgi:hypothetical protein
MRILAAIALVMVMAAPVYAQNASCRPHDEAVAWLKNSHQEVRVGYGYRPQLQRIVELFVSPAGTWTILSTDNQGRACVRAYGSGWTATPGLGEPTSG